MAKQDPYMLDPQEQETIHKKKTKLQSSGIPCPKRHPHLGGVCYVCDRVSALFNTGLESDKKIALDKMAKGKYYFNAVLPHEPDKNVLLEVGKKAGDAIIHGIKTAGWVDIAHPKANKGREMIITRSGSGRNDTVYSPSPNLNKADWDIPDSVLKNLFNLDNILEIIHDPDVPLIKTSSLKPDEKIIFRICPPWDNGKNNREIYTIVWRHWGVTQDEIDGKIALNLATPNREEDNSEDRGTTPNTEVPLQTTEITTSSQKDEPCLGNGDLFDKEDDECRKCRQYRQCMKIVLKKKVNDDDIPF